jgi:EAL domain-containing protein (putative c-di-GMP-specific phosphodiesterase class I)
LSVPERFGLWLAVSAEELADPGFAESFERLTVAHAVPPNAIILEIPAMSLAAAAGAAQVVRRLSKLGVNFVVDDFGASKADLSLLDELPIAGLRIAADLVADLDLADRRSPALVRGLIALGHELHLEVLGQGVATHAQVVALRAMGCNLAQGHALGDPGSFDQLWGPIEPSGLESPALGLPLHYTARP